MISLQVAKLKYVYPAPEIQDERAPLASESAGQDVAPPAQASSVPATLGVKPDAWPEEDPDA